MVEREAGERIVTVTGGLDLWPADPAIPQRDYTASLAAEGVPYELLDAAEIRRRWPQWQVEDGVTGMFQVQGGLADPNRGNAAHRRLALEHAATLLDRCPVLGLRDLGGGELEVRTAEVRYRTGRVIVTADAWTNRLLASFGRTVPLTVTKEQVTYFACPDPAAFAPDRFPVWIWMDDPSFYGFPTYGEAGPKVAQDCGGLPVDPDTRTFDRDEAAFERVTTFMAAHLPGAVGPPIYTKTCLYSLTPDRDFVVDRLPGHPGTVVALGAGHGFKYASLLGRIVAELSIDGATPSAPDLEAFRIDRPILLEADPPHSWMV
jgi:sarcosine oxidase